jgi:carbamoyltransferase
MNIIGVSGLEQSVPFKIAHWPGLDEREYRMSQGFESAAALVVDGVVVAAAAEERFNRKKHSAAFPAQAVQYCLKEAGLSLDQIDEIAHAFDYMPYKNAYAFDSIAAKRYQEVYSRDVFAAQVGCHLPGLPINRVRHVNHHLAHAASAYFTSGWEECLVVVIDGMGEVDGASVYLGEHGRLTPIHHLSAYDSIGIFYSLLTLHLGFDFNSDEYKIMGLAPYGDPQRFRPFFNDAVKFEEDGSLRIASLRLNKTREERENFLATRRYLAERLIPERKPEADITDDHRDVAAGLQDCLDRTLEKFCGHFGVKTGLRRLALAGGVALNCTANGRLLQANLFDEIYVQPAAGDDGAALGAALYRASHRGVIPNLRSPVPFFGPAYSSSDIDRDLNAFAERIDIVPFSNVTETCEAAAACIARGEVVGWYQGRMEFGPRALGHRSILADPGHPEMRDRINAMVKMRESFRPFAPAVTIEQGHYWFDMPPLAQMPYMIITVDVRAQHRTTLPAITHVNGSARVQTVSAESDKVFHTLLRAVGKATGREMVLNTSFNVKGQPIVNTPREAVETFLVTGIDVLFLGNVMVRRACNTKKCAA